MKAGGVCFVTLLQVRAGTAACDGSGAECQARDNVLLQASSHLARSPVAQHGLLAATSSDWTGSDLHATHYWDCSGQGCDATVLQPWDQTKYISPPGYGPQDPTKHGGAVYGEKMWLTGAASDVLGQLMGGDDGCCGKDTDSGACGRCLLIQNPDSVNPDWTAVVMKKNRCPPWTNGCGSNDAHFDIAAPGFDNLQYSTANICGQSGTGFGDQQASAALGSWYNQCSDTAECAHLCDKLPAEFQEGCKLFASWGWKQGDPSGVKYKAVDCPAAFKQHVGSLFGPSGPSEGSSESPPTPVVPNPQPAPQPTPAPMPTPTTPISVGAGASMCCSWSPYTECGDANDYCSANKQQCETCNGQWKALGSGSPAPSPEPTPPPQDGPSSSDKCCSWAPYSECGQDAWCNALQANCEGACGGSFRNI